MKKDAILIESYVCVLLAREVDARKTVPFSPHKDVTTRTGEPPRKSSPSTWAVSFSSS